MTLTQLLPRIDVGNDMAWIGYEVFGQARAPAPHTWQDWLFTVLFFVILAAAAWCVSQWTYRLWSARDPRPNWPLAARVLRMRFRRRPGDNGRT
jgi:hypothetical protein